MNLPERVASRSTRWAELEKLCERLERITASRLTAVESTRFASLYRSACADLALAESYHLPEDVVRYLNRLVGRAHNQLYRSKRFQIQAWGRRAFVDVPRALLGDRILHLTFLLFWGTFILCAVLAKHRAGFAEEIVGPGMLSSVESMYETSLEDMDANERSAMAGFYIWNNAGIGLKCFATGPLGGVIGLFVTATNAAFLGVVFGHMTTVDPATSKNFFTFVTAHGPFELTAIVLGAAAGARLGFAVFWTRGYTRRASIRREAWIALPVGMVAVVLFILAAGIEAFVSPAPIPYPIKQGVAVASALLLLFYYFGLGFAAKMSSDRIVAAD